MPRCWSRLNVSTGSISSARTRADYKWRKWTRAAERGDAFAAANFRIDWALRHATCPEGRVSSSWTPAIDNRKNEVVKIKFATAECVCCPSRQMCTGSKRVRRTLTVRPEAQFKALQAAREREQTAEYAALYAKRSGVEGTISQGTRSFGLRRARYVGQAKTHLQHVLTATAINLVRVANWIAEVPLAKTRRTRFQRLMMQPASG